VTRHVGRTGAAATKWRLEFSDARISALFPCEIKRRRLGTRFANWVFAGTPTYGDQQLRAESAAALHEKGDFDEDCDSLYLGLAHGRSLGGAGDSLPARRRSLIGRSAELLAVQKPFAMSNGVWEMVRIGSWLRRSSGPALSILLFLSYANLAHAQEPPVVPPTAPAKEELTPAPAKIEITPMAADDEIVERLQSVLEATEWFENPRVRVQDGVVFLSGTADTEELKKWAGDLARNTQDVVAVANRIEVAQASTWDFSLAWSGVANLWRETKAALPFIVLGILILALSVLMGLAASRVSRPLFGRQIRTKLLLNVATRGVGILVFLMGAYIVLRVSGMTQLALSIIGGTGLVGLAVGIAFREITENFLASIFLSMHRPFETGDFIEVGGVSGFVQQLNIRTTIVMTLEGILVQIPNASVYKNNLRNFTTNANRREEISVGIPYGDSLDEAQEIARQVLITHPAVLKDPEPMVLADSFLPTHINLRIYYWINGKEHSVLKVKSSIIRLLKNEFQCKKLLLYPVGFPPPPPQPHSPEQDLDGNLLSPPSPVPVSEVADGKVTTKAELGLQSEASVIKEQARQAETLKLQENLLKKKPPEEAANDRQRFEAKV
jgi:small conductance mechanosensitive channel